MLAEVGWGLLGAVLVAFFIEHLGESKDEEDKKDPEMVHDEGQRMGTEGKGTMCLSLICWVQVVLA